MSAEAIGQAVFVAFDTETTGLIAGVDRIVEVAAVVFRAGTVLDEHEQLIDPGVPIPAVVSAINNISDAMVRGMPSIGQGLPGLLAMLGKGTPVAHNAGFDAGFLSAAIQASGLAAPEAPILDTRALARAAFPGRQSYSLDNLARDLRPAPLAGAGERESLAHRALADARTCAALLEACTRALAPRGCDAVEDLVRASGPRLDLAANAPRQPMFAAMLDEARRTEAVVEIEYVSASGERTVREIRPLAFRLQGGSPVVTAFCRLRNQDRTFRLDAIRDVRRLA